ncbi:hypothetical protein MLD38_034479 [Melastoma candidum]|uniref:Uncharacterized protein n=1 Tax=Melastoma candidum TaxID=119954 RepID=A0ACB9M9U0_9MYRT|nr:hypothetical protein MLD38_034479 [Melastoma candidum]
MPRQASFLAPSSPHYCYRPRRHDSWARLLAPLTIWLCVSMSLRYGYYGDLRMVVGPGSSRLIRTSSWFVKHVVVRDVDGKGASTFGFAERPELSHEDSWTVSKYLIVGSYNRKGFNLWLNKGSRIRMQFEAHSSHLNQLEVAMIKGERRYETLKPSFVRSMELDTLSENGQVKRKETEYTIEEDDKYYVRVLNTHSKSIITSVSVTVTSRIYDLTKANARCFTSKASCRLRLQFPETQYVVLTTPANGDLGDWYFELSFIARIVTYISILGFLVVFVYLLLKYLGVCDIETETFTYDPPVPVQEATASETSPIIPSKQTIPTYGTNEDDRASSSSSEDLYDAKLCGICYDEQRNCFFIPCGHCATCYDCAQKIMEGDSRVCPICRRLIHKVRRLFTA